MRLFILPSLLLLLAGTPLVAQATAEKNCALRSLEVCVLHVAQDEAGIITAPLHMKQESWLWVAPVGVAVGYGIDRDADAMRALGTDPKREKDFKRVSDFGGIYGPLASVGVGYLVGSVRHDDRLRETAVLASEAMADAAILNTGLGYAINRQTPGQGDGTGRFWPHGTRTWPDGQSMPSDHSVLVWSFARVVTSQYGGIATKTLVYSLATTVSASRVIARQHFPSDVVLGSALGYAIGGYVVQRRGSDNAWSRVSIAPVATPNGRGLELSYNFMH
jgi:hypothetical protein